MVKLRVGYGAAVFSLFLGISGASAALKDLPETCRTALTPAQVLRAEATTEALRAFFGEPVSAVLGGIERVVVEIDQFFASSNASAASRVRIELRAPSLAKPGIVFTVKDLWLNAEFAQLRMTLAEQRIAELEGLKQLHADDEAKVAKLEALMQAEYHAYAEQARDLGNNLLPYTHIRRHLESILMYYSLSSHATKNGVKYFLKDSGSNDPRMMSKVHEVEKAYSQALTAMGIQAADFDAARFHNLVANNVGALAAAKTKEEVEAEKKALEAGEEAVRESVLALREIALRANEFPVQSSMANHDRGQQVAFSLSWFLQKPVLTQFFYTLLGKTPFGSAFKDNPAFKWLTRKFRDHELVRLYSYSLTRLHRNWERAAKPTDLAAEQPTHGIGLKDLIEEVMGLIPRGAESKLSPLETLVRRSDTRDLWIAVRNAILADETGMYTELKPEIERWEALRAEGKLEPLSPTYTSSPLDNTLTLVLGALALHPGIREMVWNLIPQIPQLPQIFP